jgi:hypothetical protein
MTKILLEFELTGPLDGDLLERISAAHGIYGLLRLKLAPQLDRVTVEYDASRLTPSQVEAALHRAGIPARAPTV